MTVVGVGAAAGLCLEPEPEISKMGGSGNPGILVSKLTQKLYKAV